MLGPNVGRGSVTKKDLVREVADELIVTRNDANLIVSTVLDSIIEALRGGESVVIRDFGSFRLKHRAGRTARNPASGGEVRVPARSVPRFSPSKRLRAAVSAAEPGG